MSSVPVTANVPAQNNGAYLGQDISPKDDWLTIAKSVLHAETEAIEVAAQRLDGNLTAAMETILRHPGKVVVSGVGKSGYAGMKLAATLCSTGTQAVFLHAGEAVHGDLGIYQAGDPSILISNSGTTAEILRLLPTLRGFGSPLIAIVGNASSPLAQQADIVLNAQVAREADHLELVPTTSTLVALALGDALACALMHARRFTEQDYARFHPGGQLGRTLTLRVADVMHNMDRVACVVPETSLRETVIAMTEFPLGAACVLNESGKLLGLITDGDVRRTLQRYEDIRLLKARDVMTANPIGIQPDVTLREAIRVMENRPRQISVLPVVDSTDGSCLGLVRLHDFYQPEAL